MYMNLKDMVDDLRELTAGMRRSDAKDIRHLAKLIEQEKGSEAYKFWRSLDTIIREIISDDIVSWLSVNRVKAKKAVKVEVVLKGCKNVLREDFGPGVVAMTEVIFPGNVTETEMERGLLHFQEKLMKNTVEIRFGKLRTVRKHGIFK